MKQVGTTAKAQLEPIPQPPGHFLIGNLLDLRGGDQLFKLMKLAQAYGPIIRLKLPARGSLCFLSSFEVIRDVLDDERFDKHIGPILRAARGTVGDGLVTAYTHEANWIKAHNILLPSFSAQAIRSSFAAMQDLAGQLATKWSRLNPEDEVDIAEDMTSLTFDTIGLAAFNYRFNSFYRSDPHPFIAALADALLQGQSRVRQLPIQRKLNLSANRRFAEDLALMYGLVDDIIAQRISGAVKPHDDLLQAMLEGVDRTTGEKLDPTNIRYQIMTFLFAGHDTTSGLLSFALYYVMKNPHVLAKAREEVDRVLGGGDELPTQEQVRQLAYVSQILQETLRLWPTIPMIARCPRGPAVLAGRYAVDTDDNLTLLIGMLHRDPAIWGDKAEIFDPENFAPDAVAGRPPGSFLPFGTGQRACIGRHFALLEGALVLGVILQRFALVDHSGYELEIRQALTIKPTNFRVRVRLREDRPTGGPAVAASQPAAVEAEASPAPLARPPSGAPVLVLFGSNLGGSEEIAHQIAADGADHGFATTVAPLDEHAGELPREGAVIIVSSSYNGTPPDNAADFFRWVTSGELPSDSLAGVRYTVFGCGDRDWAQTYQRVPTMIDEGLAAAGATRFYGRGEGDQSGDFDGQFRGWYDHLWDTAAEALGTPADVQDAIIRTPRFQIQIDADADAPEELVALFSARPFDVLANRELQTKSGPNPSDRSTRHIELAVAEGVTYRAGDHLGVLPRNSEALTERALGHFGLAPSTGLCIRSNTSAKTVLPIDRTVQARHLFRDYLALQDPARRSDIQVAAEYAEDEDERNRLSAMGDDGPDGVLHYRNEILAKTVSLLDLLETHPSCKLPLNRFVELVPPLKPRYYSISSSEKSTADRCSVTVGVVEGPARSGRGTYRGVASGFLADLVPGDHVEAFVRPPSLAFFPPENPSVPMIMVGAGTGLAPFRGFLQERRAMREAGGHDLGEALLVFGCRNPDQDYIYRDELAAFERDGIVEVVTAFSRVAGEPKTYVQTCIAAEGARVWRLLQDGAVVFVCGDAATMAPAVEAAFRDLYEAHGETGGRTAEDWMADLKKTNRYLVDIWPRG